MDRYPPGRHDFLKGMTALALALLTVTGMRRNPDRAYADQGHAGGPAQVPTPVQRHALLVSDNPATGSRGGVCHGC